jgi:hypothetical protein
MEVKKTDPEPAIDEKLWRTWVEKGRVHERTQSRRVKYLSTVIVLVLFVTICVSWLWL